jgi:hypothetical protein
MVEMDLLLNLYSLKGAELRKYDSKGNFQFEYSDKQLGEITQVDATFPLRILVTYRELNYVVMLDNTLSDNRGTINLLNLGLGLGTVACSSVQNHFWFYDAMTFSLSRYSENFTKILETGNLSQILGVELEPVFMAEFANRLYVNNPESGILVFDIFGTYIRNIPVKGISKFQLFENGIAYFKDGKLCKYDFRLNEINEIELPVKANYALIQKDRVAILTDSEILVYRYLGS